VSRALRIELSRNSSIQRAKTRFIEQHHSSLINVLLLGQL
jgi:hypothetical protein